MPLAVKYPKTRQAESCESKELFDEGPYNRSPDCEDRVIGVHNDVVNLREPYDGGDY